VLLRSTDALDFGARREPTALPDASALSESESEAHALSALDAVLACLLRASQRVHTLAAAAPALQAFVLPPLFPPDDPLMSALLDDVAIADRVAADAFAVLRDTPSLTLFEADALVLCARRSAELATLVASRATPLRALLLRGQEALGDASLAQLAAACPHLEIMELTCSPVTPDGVAHLLRACPRLRTLSIAHSSGMDGPELMGTLLPALNDAQCLTALDLSGCALSAAFVAALPCALGARMQGLGLGDAPGLSDALLASLALHCPSLCALDITAADDRVSPAALAALFAMPQMVALTALRSDADWGDESEDDDDDGVAVDDADVMGEEREVGSAAPLSGAGSVAAPPPPRAGLLQRMPRHAQSAFESWFVRSTLLAPRPPPRASAGRGSG
jgi:hypothetical protein